jgi:GR25 family glycosyltransferase involved in LPS biosynthesis
MKSVDPADIIETAKYVTWGAPRNKAVSLWKNIVKRFPGNDAIADQYLTELILVEDWVSIEEFWDTSRGIYSPTMQLKIAMTSILTGHTDIALRRVNELKTKYPQILQNYAIHALFDLAIADRNYDEALKIYSKNLEILTDHVNVKKLIFYKKQNELWNKNITNPLDYNIYLINLDRDETRLARSLKQINCPTVNRIPGVKGSYLPDWALNILTNGIGAQLKGTCGCFLSHVSAWEEFLKQDRVDVALILEDDACVLYGLPNLISDLKFPNDFDICFANERMQAMENDFSGFKLLKIEDVVKTKPDDWSSAGTDAYFISRKGANRLLQMISVDGIAGDIDWRLIFYSLSNGLVYEAAKNQGFFGRSLEFHLLQTVSMEKIEAYALQPALVRQFAAGSVRLWDNKMPSADIEQVNSFLRKRIR